MSRSYACFLGNSHGREGRQALNAGGSSAAYRCSGRQHEPSTMLTRMAEPEGFEPSIRLYKRITV